MKSFVMEWILGFGGIIFLVIGLIGQGIEMRKIRMTNKDEELGSVNIFINKKNFKWYVILGIGIIRWFIAERM
jgi:hypothetical protein